MPRKRTEASHVGGLSYTSIRGLLFVAAFSVTILTCVAGLLGLFSRAWFDYTVSMYYFLITGGVMILACLFILLEVRNHGSLLKGLQEDFNVWMAGGIINLLPGVWASVVDNHRSVEAEFIDNGQSKYVEDYSAVPDALADAHFHTYWGVVLALNTGYFIAVFLPKYVTPFLMGMCNNKYRAVSGTSSDGEGL